MIDNNWIIDKKILDDLVQKMTQVWDFILDKYQKAEVKAEYKEWADIVTDIDREAEIMIRDFFEDNFPGHSINGEEFWINDNNSDYTWYIDPIDWTKYFNNNISLFVTCVWLRYKDQPVFWIVYNPSIKKIVYWGDFYWWTYLNWKKVDPIEEKPVNMTMMSIEQCSIWKNEDAKNIFRRDIFDSILKRSFYRCRGVWATWALTLGFDLFQVYMSAKIMDITPTSAVLKPLWFNEEFIDLFWSRYIWVGKEKTMNFIKETIKKVEKISDKDIENMINIIWF